MVVFNTKLTFCFVLSLMMVKLIFAGGIKGTITNSQQEPIYESIITLKENGLKTKSNEAGYFIINNIEPGNYLIIVTHPDYSISEQIISVIEKQVQEIRVVLLPKAQDIGPVLVTGTKLIGRGPEITEDQVRHGKNVLVIKQEPDKMPSTSITRSLPAPVPIVEYDGAGLQLGIGGRGLNPKRTAHYNTRQNGYEISADALGYPETYYTPPSEAIEEISLIRGAASLQFGPQFGGMINFKLKDGPVQPKDKIELISSSKYGSFKQFHTFNSLATQNKKLKTYSFYQYKIGDGWRDNTSYISHSAYSGLSYQANKKLSLRLQLTKHFYIAQQAGGLTDIQFKDNPQQSFRKRNWFSVDWNIVALIAHYKIGKDSWINSKTFYVNSARNSVGFLDNSSRIDPLGNRLLIKGNFENIGNETRWVKRYTINEKNAALISGLRLYKGWAETSQSSGTSNSDANFKNSNVPEYSQYKFPSANASAFIENTFFLSNRFYITPGYRYEYISTKTDGYFNQYVVNNANDTLLVNNIKNNSTNNRDIHLLGTGITFKGKQNGKWIANISKNFRSVNFSDINIVVPNFRIDSNIQDEKGFTADFSFNKSWGKKAYFNLTGYMLHYSNRIGVIWQTDETTWDTYQYRTNVSASRTIGFELTNWVNLSKIISLNDSIHQINLMTNATLNNAKYTDKNTPVYGNWVEMVPALTLKSSLTYEYKNWLLSGLINFQTQQFSEATNAEESTNGLYGIIPPFYVIDSKFGYNFKKVLIQLSINNLTNNNYFTQRANSYPGPGIIPSEGRTYWTSLIFKL